MNFKKDIGLFFASMTSSQHGGREKYLLRHGGAPPPATLPGPTLSQTLNAMSSSMATNYAQPLAHNVPTTNVMTMPNDYYLQFDPLLSNGRSV